MFTYSKIKDFFEQRKKLGVKPGLQRIQHLLASLGNPEKQLKAIHVAGTNGKGSTIHFLQSVLLSSGHQVGVFTSPSMDGLKGHILHQNNSIRHDKFVEMFQRVFPYVQYLDDQGEAPTSFEILTAMAFLYFSENVDIAIIETGMGGQHDTTNCLKPMISIITNIEKDHMIDLGYTLPSIARHKAGIIKKETPVIIGRIANNALSIITEKAKAKQAPLYQLGKEFDYQMQNESTSMQSFTWSSGTCSLNVSLNLLGKHQVENCSLALKALTICKKRFLISIQWQRAIEKLNKLSIPGRFEKIYEKPDIYIDGAHNVAGLLSFLNTVDQISEKDDKRVMFAAFKDKNFEAMVRHLKGTFSKIYLTSFDHPRAATKQHLRPFTDENQVIYMDDWQEMLVQLIQSKQADGPYFITGSINFIISVRRFLLNRDFE